MKLIASVLVRNELGRYLVPFMEHLAAFCDEVIVIDDCSDDGTFEQLQVMPEVTYIAQPNEPSFFQHEGQFRNRLLDFTLARKPSHILAIDADEFVSDGQRLRSLCEQPGTVWTLRMDEVWKADEDKILIRVDGRWGNRPVPMLYSVPDMPARRFRIADRKIACGREPEIIARQAIRGRATVSGVSCLHFGWTREAERDARYQRYVTHDLGKPGGHADQHLRSIMFPDEKVTLQEMPWPDSLDREAILR